MKIVMVAGGTGGHIYPAVALAERYIEKGDEVVFYGANNRLEKTLIPELGFDFVGFDIKSTSGGILNKIKSLMSMIRTYFIAKKYLKEYDLVIGFGNYISLPIVKAAQKLHIKTVLHEQNSVVGKANKALESKADLVVASYANTMKDFKNPKAILLGNPQSSKALKEDIDANYLSELGLNKDLKTITIFMGSLGSQTVHKIVMKMLNKYDFSNYQILYASGQRYYDEVKDFHKTNVFIKERVDGLKAMSLSNLLVSRAGATTLSEITAKGVASILIPSPYVTNNHQLYNAKVLSDVGACEILEEKDLTEESLYKLINKLIDDEKYLVKMRKNAKSLCNENVIEDMIERIDELWR